MGLELRFAVRDVLLAVGTAIFVIDEIDLADTVKSAGSTPWGPRVPRMRRGSSATFSSSLPGWGRTLPIMSQALSPGYPAPLTAW